MFSHHKSNKVEGFKCNTCSSTDLFTKTEIIQWPKILIMPLVRFGNDELRDKQVKFNHRFVCKNFDTIFFKINLLQKYPLEFFMCA